MSGYAATARLTGTPINPGPSLRAGLQPLGSRALAEILREAGSPADDPPRIPLADRLRYARQAWSQMTFYLFDPESWR